MRAGLYAVPPVGTEVEEGAVRAAGQPWPAGLPAEADQVEVKLELRPRGDERGEGVVSVTPALPQPQPPRDPRDVGVHGEQWPPEPEEKHHVRRLFPHASEGEEPARGLLVRELGEEVEGEGASPVADPAEHLLDPRCPLPVEPRPPDRVGHLLGRGSKHSLPRRGRLTQHGVGHVAVAVRRVLGKNCPDEEIEGRFARAQVRWAVVREEAPGCFREPLVGGHDPEG